MKGIIIKNEEGSYQLTFKGGFIVIENNGMIKSEPRRVAGDVVKTYRKSGETRYEKVVCDDGKMRYRLKDKFKKIKGDTGWRSECAKKSWETRRARVEQQKQKDEYEGLAKLNQNLNE